MLHKHLREEWPARKRAISLSPVLTFAPEGLVLGAGTMIVPADAPRRLQSLRGQEARVLALLSAACGKAVAPSVLGNVERATKAWNDGDDCLAYVHLSHSGLQPLNEFRAGAYRLLMARCAMMAGASPRDVFEALHLDARYIETIEKAYNPDEPRVPAGSGRTSGEWTDIDGATQDDADERPAGGGTTNEVVTEEDTRGSILHTRMPLPAPEASSLGELTATQVAELSAYAWRVLRVATPVGAAAAVFGLLFIPSPNNIRVEGDVPEIPGLRYSWNRDENQLHLTYDEPGGRQRTFAAYLDGDVFCDVNGRIIGRVIDGNRVVIDVISVLPVLAKDNEPRLCPAPAPDEPGSDQGKPYEQNRARQYEDLVKKLINPPPTGPTPSGFVYYLQRPNGEPVSFDDCQFATGFLFPIKGAGYSSLLQNPVVRDSVAAKFVRQSGRQIDASGGRPIIWIFAERRAAIFTRELFDRVKEGRERITIIHVPWTDGEP